MQSNQEQLDVARRLLTRFPDRKPEEWLRSLSEVHRLAGVLLLRKTK